MAAAGEISDGHSDRVAIEVKTGRGAEAEKVAVLQPLQSQDTPPGALSATVAVTKNAQRENATKHVRTPRCKETKGHPLARAPFVPRCRSQAHISGSCGRWA